MILLIMRNVIKEKKNHVDVMTLPTMILLNMVMINIMILIFTVMIVMKMLS